MAYPKSSKSALLALAVSGGIWAWQNRTKISAWANQQLEQQRRTQQQRQPVGQSVPVDRPYTGSSIPGADAPYTGSTRRIDESEIGGL